MNVNRIQTALLAVLLLALSGVASATPRTSGRIGPNDACRLSTN